MVISLESTKKPTTQRYAKVLYTYDKHNYTVYYAFRIRVSTVDTLIAATEKHKIASLASRCYLIQTRFIGPLQKYISLLSDHMAATKRQTV